MSDPREPSVPFSQTKNHLLFADALRGIAILGVILVHSTLLTGQTGTLFVFGFAGQKGVQLFYVVSAFTLCHSFDLRNAHESRPLRNYFIRRFFRIAPLFYLAVLGNLLVHGLAPRDKAPEGLTPWEIFGGLLFLNGFHPHTINTIAMGGWSIAVESSFYLVLPVVLLFVTSAMRSVFLFLISLVLAPALGHFCLLYFTKPEWEGYFLCDWLPIQFPVFCMGICAYFICKDGRLGHTRRKLLSFIFLVSAVLLFLVSLPLTSFIIYPPSFAFIPLVLGLFLHPWRVLVNPFTVFLGRISYSIYLTHFFFLLAVQYAWDHRLFFFPLCPVGTFPALVIVYLSIFLPTVLVSTLTYWIIETPGIRLGKLLIQSWEKLPILGRL